MSFWSRISGWPKAHPLQFGVYVAGCKTIAADILVQKQIEKREKIDYKRTALFAAFGFGYLGLFQYAMYVTAFKRMFPNMQRFSTLSFRDKMRDGPGKRDLVKQICFDNFVHPIWFFPVYYTMKESIQGETNILSGDFSKSDVIVGNALDKYKKNAWEDWTSFWKIWILGDALVFCMPLWARLPANHGISFVYVCILSLMRGDAPPVKMEALEGEKRLIGQGMSS